MDRVRVADVELQYEIIGQGLPLLLIPGSNIAAGMAPLSKQLVEAGKFKIIRYHRRGMGGSTQGEQPMTVQRQAADAVGLLDALGIPAAHVCAYSYGGTVGIEVALAAPEKTLSLALVEPIIASVPSAPSFFGTLSDVRELYSKGDIKGAITATFQSMGGERWRELVESTGEGAIEQAFVDAPIFFEHEKPSLADWSFDEERGGRFKSPVLSIVADKSHEFFSEGRERLHRWFPNCKDENVVGANHMLNLQQPRQIAQAVTKFVLSADARA